MTTPESKPDSSGATYATPACACRPMQPMTWAWFAALVGWTLVIAFFQLSAGGGLEPSEAWVAQPAREMSENVSRMIDRVDEDGWDWRPIVVPTLCNETRLQKSPGAYWAVCLTAYLRGTPVDEVSARIPSAIAAVLLVITVFWLTRRIAGERAAIFAGFATAASAMLLHWSHGATSDLGVATLIAMSLACLWVGLEDEPPGAKRVVLLLLGYLFAGLAMLYKMPLPLPCIGLPAILYVVLRNRWRVLASWWHLLGLVLFLLPWLPWMLAVMHFEPMALDKWRVEYLDRVTGDLPATKTNAQWYFYLMYAGAALIFSFPFTLSVFGAVARPLRRVGGAGLRARQNGLIAATEGRPTEVRTSVHRNGMFFLLIWFVSILVFLTFAAGKETRYFPPAMPPLFALLGCELAALFDPKRAKRPEADRAAFVAVLVLVPAGLGGVTYVLHEFWSRHASKGMFTWPEVWQPYAVTAALFAFGVILAAWLYMKRREAASFAALVGGVWAAWLWAWTTLMPVLGSQAPFEDFAAKLKTLTPGQVTAVRQVGHQDPRYIWYSDVRFPRVIDQLELLKEQDGRRNLNYEYERVGEEMVRRLRLENLTLFVASPKHYVVFHTVARARLEQRGETLPKTYIWRMGEKGREDRRYILFGNQPPSWDEPALSERLQMALAKQLEKARREVAEQSGALPPPTTQPAASRPAPTSED